MIKKYHSLVIGIVSLIWAIALTIFFIVIDNEIDRLNLMTIIALYTSGGGLIFHHKIK
jgi:hypothetical protein